MINNHKHSGLGGDGQKINYNSLLNLPVIPVVPPQVIPQFYTTIKSFLAGTDGLGSYVITDVGFKPKLVQINSARVPGGIDPTFSMTNIIEDGAGGFNYAEFWNDQSNSVRVRDTLAVRVTDTGGSPGTTAIMKSFDTDGLTLDFTKIDWNIDMTITCFG